MQLEIATISKTGGRKVNEDACDYWSSSTVSCYVLSDGLGGHFGGDVASKLVLRSIRDEFLRSPECSIHAIESLLHAGDDAIIQEQQRNNELKHMRATAVVLIVDTARHLATWGHIGDSRLYCFRKDRIVSQTRDHSVSQNMVDAGYLKPEELRLSSNRNQLYAALGNSDHFQMDISPVVFSIGDGDVFLMCSDGLWEYVEESEMESTLSSSVSVSEWIEILEKKVIMRGHNKQDNYSAIAVWCSDSEEKTLFPM